MYSLKIFQVYTIEVDDVSPLEIMTAKESELSSSLQIYPTVPMPSETYKRAIESFKDEIAKVENQLKNHSRDKADENFNKSKLTELLNLQQLLEDTFRQPRTVVRFYEYIKQYINNFKFTVFKVPIVMPIKIEISCKTSIFPKFYGLYRLLKFLYLLTKPTKTKRFPRLSFFLSK
mgnify:CR=1 FL=1